MFSSAYLHSSYPSQRGPWCYQSPMTSHPLCTEMHAYGYPPAAHGPTAYGPTYNGHSHHSVPRGHSQRGSHHGPHQRQHPYQWHWFPLSFDSEEGEDEDNSSDEQGPSLDELFNSYFQPRRNEKKSTKEPKKQQKEDEGAKKGKEGEQMKTETGKKAKPQQKPNEDKLKTTIDDIIKAVFGAFTPKSYDATGHNGTRGCQKGKPCHNQKARTHAVPKAKTTYQDKPSKTKEAASDAKSTELSPQTEPENTGKQIITKLRLQGFDPNTIEIKVVSAKREIQIWANYPVMSPFGAYMVQKCKVVPIPNGTNPKDIKSFLNDDNILIIQADTPAKKPEKQDTNKSPAQSEQASPVEMSAGNKGGEKSHLNESTTSTVNRSEINDPKLNASQKDESDVKQEPKEHPMTTDSVVDTEMPEARIESEATTKDSEADRSVSAESESTGKSVELNKIVIADEFDSITPEEHVNEVANETETTGFAESEDQDSLPSTESMAKDGQEQNDEEVFSIGSHDEEFEILEHSDTAQPAASDHNSDETQISSDATDPSESPAKEESILAQFEMSGFASDDIKFRFNGGYLEISAKREDETTKGIVQREYFRAVPLPANVNPRDIRTKLDVDDVFYVIHVKDN